MILTIIVFLFILGLLVLAHEFGHFIAAKRSGVKVEEFAIGFPPRLFSKKYGETEYSINLIPIGGYVKMLGELEHSKDPRAFENQKPWKRFIIAIAGVVLNVVLGWIILTIGFSIGMSPIVSDPNTIPGKIKSSEVIVAGVDKDSAAEKAGLLSGDVLISGEANGEKTNFKTSQELSNFTKNNEGKKVTFEYKEDNQLKSSEIYLSENEAPLGVTIVQNSVIQVPWYKAPIVALRESSRILWFTLEFLGQFIKNLFVRGEYGEGLGGPVAIYMYTGLAISAGWMVLMQFIAILSLNLALLNVLPFPALDGGRLIFIASEGIFRKKLVKEKVENIIHNVGFIVLIIILIAITYKDISRLF